MRRYPALAWLYAAVVATIAAAGVLLWARADGGLHIANLVGFGILFIAAEFAPVSFAHVYYSVGFVVAIAAVVASGPATAAVAAAFASIDREMLHRSDRAGRLLFNAGQFSLSTLALGTVYRVLDGPVGQIHAGDFPAALGPIAAGTAAFYVTNTLLVAFMVAGLGRLRVREVLDTDYRAALTSYVCLSGLGVAAAALHTQIGWAALVFVIPPLVLARHAFQTSKNMQQAFDGMLTSLVGVIEAKDPYTRGHAERVSRLAALIARSRGLGESTARRIRYAALLHDVGKVAVDTRILRKPGKLSVEEFDHMKIHSIVGSELVSEIDLLKGMVDGVRHHHERLDGRGYPDGLEGSEISQVARIIMVADAFDSMTSTRSYRKAMPMEKAMAELRRCAGIQFAPEMIDALERALARSGWEPAPEPYAGELTPRPVESPHAALG